MSAASIARLKITLDHSHATDHALTLHRGAAGIATDRPHPASSRDVLDHSRLCGVCAGDVESSTRDREADWPEDFD